MGGRQRTSLFFSSEEGSGEKKEKGKKGGSKRK